MNTNPERMRPAVFFDRDGVLVDEVAYLHSPDDVRVVQGTASTVKWVNDAGYLAVVVTNQAGIGRGLYTWDDFRSVQAHIDLVIRSVCGRIDAVYACPFHEEALQEYRYPDHPDRKPNPGMFLKAASEHSIDLTRSWVVGDRDTDLLAGKRAGVAGGILVLTGYGLTHADKVRQMADAHFAVAVVGTIAEVPQTLAKMARVIP
jgi:D-glycero-D-manno-heptose 1,7-bisphosphate phosphatase